MARLRARPSFPRPAADRARAARRRPCRAGDHAEKLGGRRDAAGRAGRDHGIRGRVVAPSAARARRSPCRAARSGRSAPRSARISGQCSVTISRNSRSCPNARRSPPAPVRPSLSKPSRSVCTWSSRLAELVGELLAWAIETSRSSASARARIIRASSSWRSSGAIASGRSSASPAAVAASAEVQLVLVDVADRPHDGQQHRLAAGLTQEGLAQRPARRAGSAAARSCGRAPADRRRPSGDEARERAHRRTPSSAGWCRRLPSRSPASPFYGSWSAASASASASGVPTWIQVPSWRMP